MTRSVSQPTREALFAQETSKAWIILLTISHDNLSEDIRVSSDSTDTEHDGDTYVAFPFEIEPFGSDPDEIQTVELRIGNVDRQIVEAIREINSPPDVEIKVIDGENPDTVEAELPGFSLENVRYNELVVTGEIQKQHFLDISFPKHRFVPSDFQALPAQ